MSSIKTTSQMHGLCGLSDGKHREKRTEDYKSWEDKWHNTIKTRHKDLSCKTWRSMREIVGKTTRNDRNDLGNAREDIATTAKK